MRILVIFGLVGLLGACGESGPSEAEMAKMKVQKECGKLYGGQTKVYKDQLHKKGVSGVEFAPKPDYVAKCVEAALTPEQMKCMDPNLGGTEECKKELDAIKDKTKELTDFLLKPTMDKLKKAKEEAEGGEEKKEE